MYWCVGPCLAVVVFQSGCRNDDIDMLHRATVLRDGMVCVFIITLYVLRIGNGYVVRFRIDFSVGSVIVAFKPSVLSGFLEDPTDSLRRKATTSENTPPPRAPASLHRHT